MGSRALHAVAVAVVGAASLALASCSVPDGDGVASSSSSSSQPIVGGQPDDSAGPVVLIIRCTGPCAFTPYLNVEELCSGTLVGPNLVLTARHCVAPQLDANPGVVCAQSTFDPAYPADDFVVSPAKDIYAGGPWFFTDAVAVDPSGNAVCGHDLATLRLRVPYIGATPMAPRLASPPIKTEVYSAVGYGDDLEGGLGYRHRRDGMKVQCVGPGCKLLGTDGKPLVTADEFMGETGLCGGDSGGPAIGADGLVFGVTSRGFACTLPVYERLDVHGAWLQAQGVAAAVAGGYAVPSWAYESLPASADAGSDASAPPLDADVSDAASGSDAGAGAAELDQVVGGCTTSSRHPGHGEERGGDRALFALALVCLLRSARVRSRSLS